MATTNSFPSGFAVKVRHRVPLIVLVCATLLASHPALAQFSQQGPKLVGTGAVGFASQGTSVSISADGNTAIVGGRGDNIGVGAAWVWTRSGGVWTQQGTKLVGSGAVGDSRQGTSVSLSADGSTAIVGGPGGPFVAGAAWVWTRSGGVWTQQGSKLVGSGGGDARQGESVSLSADGNTAIVGGVVDNNFAGAAWVWTRSGGVWTQQGTKLVGSGAVGNAAQGASVSLSADGNTAIVGGHADNGGTGAAWVWTRSGGVWTQQGTKLAGGQGYSVSISGDGNTAILGAVFDAAVWTRSGGVWTQQGPKLVGSDAWAIAGHFISVSLSADGNTAIIGGNGDNGLAGAAWVWTRSSGVWTQQGTKLVGSGAVGNADQGWSVSLSADGNTAIVGGPWDNSSAGAAWVFTASARGEVQILTHPVGQTVPGGTRVQLSVAAAGAGPLHYQWRFAPVGQPAQDLPGATSATFVIPAATAAEAGQYSVRVWNATSSALSRPAFLSVLADGANGNLPARLIVPPPPARQPAQSSLVVITHGWEIVGQNAAWIDTMAEAISSKLAAQGKANWQVVPVHWESLAWGVPEQALGWAEILGAEYGANFAQTHWQQVHLIAHSAGSAFIEAFAKEIKAVWSSDTEVQCTFLDPYLSLVPSVGREKYGQHADWSDCYFASDNFGRFTQGPLDHAYNVDVGWVDPGKSVIGYAYDWEFVVGGGPCAALSSHGWPHDYYHWTITNTLSTCAGPYGYALSMEAGGWGNRTSYPISQSAVPPCRVCLAPPVPASPQPWRLETPVDLSVLTYGMSPQGVVTLRNGATLSNPFGPRLPFDGREPKDDGPVPAWLAVALPVTNAVNFVQFEAAFTGTNTAEGQLTVYWNTNELGRADQRFASPGLQTYRLALPSTVTEGVYTLSFRLDSFSASAASVTVTNIATGFAGITEPITLAMVAPGSNMPPVLRLTASTGQTYLVQSSTNLTSWTPTVLLVNTNGTVHFTDPAATNGSQRFYRAMLP